jgi:hypothetical protein
LHDAITKIPFMGTKTFYPSVHNSTATQGYDRNIAATKDVSSLPVVASMCGHTIRRIEEYTMPRAKTTRTSKAKAENKVLQMPENGGNGSASHADLESEIRVRAYELYEQRGYTNGRADQDWFEAESEVRARHTNQKHTA